MTIRVAPRAADLAADLAGRFLVLVRRADDPESALRGLDAARHRLLELDGSGDEHLVSPVVLSPEGPMLRVLDLHVDEHVLHEVPALVASALTKAGVREARLDVVEARGPLDQLDTTAGAAVLRLFPAPAGEDGVLPSHWLDLAAEFVLGDASPGALLTLRLLGAPFTVAASDAAATLYAASAARAWCDLVRGDLRDRIRSASVTYGRAPHLTLAAGGPKCAVPALLARFELLCELARDLWEGVAYACVDIEPSFGTIGAGLSTAGWRAHGGASPNAVVAQVGDIAVPDAFPYQVLGPGHVARRNGQAPAGSPLEGGRIGLALGDPVDWITSYDSRDRAREQGWTALTGLLVTERELAELVLQREPPPEPVERPDAAVRVGPDLEDIVLQALPQAHRGLRVTLLELAAWLGQEPHSDAPTSVSPVLASYGRWLSSGLDDQRRQLLKPYAARLVGTHGTRLADDDWRPLAPVDEARAWLAADWLARALVPTWLDAAGLEGLADRIERVRPRKDHGHLPRLLELLAAAVEELPVDADDRAWELWERAAEASGWVAASEAALVGVPEALASGPELRVLEVARQARVRDNGEDLVASTRAAAIAAVSQAAWDSAGHRAALAVEAAIRGDVHDISLQSALERSKSAAGRRLGLDRDALDQALDLADATARAELGRIALRPPEGRRAALDQARRAAAGSPGGAAWSEVQALTEGVVGDEAWQAALHAGRVAVDRVLQTAAVLAERSTLVAIAREAAGLAARAVAQQQGLVVVDEVVDDLQAGAFELFDALLAVGDPSGRGRKAVGVG